MMYHHVVREHLALVPQRALNAYPVGWENMGWKEGDLVIHLAGCWVDDACDKRWKENWARRQTVAELKANGGIPKWGRTSIAAATEVTSAPQSPVQAPLSEIYSTPASTSPVAPGWEPVQDPAATQVSNPSAASVAPLSQPATFGSDDLD